MRSTFHGLETAKRGLFAQQTAMQTTGHNIANANTKGYSRQVVNFVASSPLEVPGITNSTAPGQLGSGVDFSSIKRVRETFLDDQFRNQNKSYGDWSIRRNTLEKIEAVINEPSEQGIRTVLDNFWNSWQELAGQPDNLTARSVVMETAMALTDTFNDIAYKFGDLKRDLEESIKIKVDDANTLITQIAELNGEIYRIERLGDNANDLRDQRDLLTDNLSKLINIDVTETAKGYTITSGATQLVADNETTLLDVNGLPDDISGGEINGFLVSLEHVDTFQAQLDQMVKGLVEGEFDLTIPKGTILPEGTTLTKVDGTELTFSGDATARTVTAEITVRVKGFNGLHQLGYTLNDPLQPGGLFFTTKDGSNNFVAGNIQLNPEIALDIRNIATSTSTYTVSGATGNEEKVIKGNNQLALWLAQMRNALITFDESEVEAAIDGEGTFDENFRAMVGRLGVKTQEAIRQEENSRILTEQVDSRRQSVSGVSLDEEMANLIKFQQAYNASARMITTIDQLLDKLINGTGVVGR
ncbi:flagellar hook-associated protein FlgK [Vulcanibacillus modesticaldus]|uniref:Flagellar hook-associated protein 1 n=1 Tax=Vulcanibacillus modesticaldus TaxID=337097 RepID=A0A1D2YV09_9BACI|nr:flagellar hook-associated protein FlgK [Vulcanibacillus modesticaldus]OEF99501.1 flagellar hook-associated protein FlgK [Vulcanibacillus modesticaldus]